MFDPTGAIALAGAVVAACYSYRCDVADAPEEAGRLAAETSILTGLLVGVQTILTTDHVDINTLSLALEDCQQTLQKISDRLIIHDPNSPASRFQRKKNRLMWPLHTKTTTGFIADVERGKSTLVLALSAPTL